MEKIIKEIEKVYKEVDYTGSEQMKKLLELCLVLIKSKEKYFTAVADEKMDLIKFVTDF